MTAITLVSRVILNNCLLVKYVGLIDPLSHTAFQSGHTLYKDSHTLRPSGLMCLLPRVHHGKVSEFSCGEPAECETLTLASVHISVVACWSSSVWQPASLHIITISICVSLERNPTDTSTQLQHHLRIQHLVLGMSKEYSKGMWSTDYTAEIIHVSLINHFLQCLVLTVEW